MRILTLFALLISTLTVAQPEIYETMGGTPNQNMLVPTSQFSALSGYHGALQTNLYYHNQWPGLLSNRVNYSATVDGYIHALKTGIGGSASHNIANFSRTSVYSVHVAPKFQIGENLVLLTGINASFKRLRNQDFVIYCFDICPNPSWFRTGGIYRDRPSEGFTLGGSAGAVYKNTVFVYQYNYDQQESFYRNFSDMHLETHRLYVTQRIDVSEHIRLSPSLYFSQYGEFRTMLGSLSLDYRNILLGAGYRWGDSMIFQAGYNIKDNFLFSYAYGMTTSNLGTPTLGTHEFGFRATFGKKRRKIEYIEKLQVL